MMIEEFNDSLSAVRDVFVFCCFTGLAYTDVKKLSSDNIEKAINGQLFISIKRTKTDNLCNIPLLDNAKSILEKYSNDSTCIHNGVLLPVISNQRYNQYLKVIAKKCDIKKNITTHTARHTFATTVTLNNNIPIEVVGAMLGHKKISTTQIYAKIVNSTINDKMLELNNKLNSIQALKVV
jgi:site-specific recombinase XerD